MLNLYTKCQLVQANTVYSMQVILAQTEHRDFQTYFDNISSSFFYSLSFSFETDVSHIWSKRFRKFLSLQIEEDSKSKYSNNLVIHFAKINWWHRYHGRKWQWAVVAKTVHHYTDSINVSCCYKKAVIQCFILNLSTLADAFAPRGKLTLTDNYDKYIFNIEMCSPWSQQHSSGVDRRPSDPPERRTGHAGHTWSDSWRSTPADSTRRSHPTSGMSRTSTTPTIKSSGTWKLHPHLFLASLVPLKRTGYQF